MKIEYICHACLSIEAGDLKIATDPWFQGSAYCGQWNVFPKPVNTDVLDDANVILLSHGHEDHFHPATLDMLPKTARVFHPYSWYGGSQPFLKGLGYSNVTEILAEKRYQLAADTFITYIVNGLDSIIVIESDGQVLVNINDALHSYPPKIIDLCVRFIKERWPHVDTVFCGFGGSSYFPNCIHCPGKDDVEIGEAREQLFAHNFCQIVHALQPVVAVPFAADFALLDPRQRWINKIRFPRAWLSEYYRELYGSDANAPSIQVMYSGDVLADNVFERRSPYWESVRENRLEHLIDEQYRDEIAAVRSINPICDTEAEVLQSEMLQNIRYRMVLVTEIPLASLAFTVRVSDLRDKPYLNITIENGEPTIRREHTRAPEAILEIETSSRILRHSFASAWGGDAITFGYGCEVSVFEQSSVTSGLDSVCVRLLTRQPQASRHWRVEPVRIAKHLLTSPTTRTWVMKSLLARNSDYSDKKNNSLIREWLFRSKCEVCRACDLPLLDENFANRLVSPGATSREILTHSS